MVEAVVVEVEETAAADAAAAEGVTVEVVPATPRMGEQHRERLVSPAPNIQICPKETNNGAVCISDGGKELFSVQTRPVAHGRMCTPPDLQNEKLTSSASKMTT